MRDQWLYAWGAGYATAGAASLLIPLHAIEQGAGPLLVGLMASTAAFVGIPGALLWGWIAGKTGRRRPFLVVALGATATILWIAPNLGTPVELLLAAGALWFVIAAAAPVLNLIVVEGTEEEDWDFRIGHLHTVQGYGWAVGLVVGTVWTSATDLLPPATAERWLFFILAAVATAAAAAVTHWYPERPTTTAEIFRRVFPRLHRRDWRTGRYLLSVPYGPGRVFWALTSAVRKGWSPSFPWIRLSGPLRSYLVAVVSFSLGFGIFWGPMPAYLRELGLGANSVFLLFLVGNLASAGSYERMGRFAASRGPRRVQLAALSGRVVLFPAVAVGSLLGATTASLSVLAVLFAAIGVSWAGIAVTSTGLVARLSPGLGRSEALGFHTAAAGLGVGVGGVLGGWIAGTVGYGIAFIASGIVVLAAVGLVRQS